MKLLASFVFFALAGLVLTQERPACSQTFIETYQGNRNACIAEVRSWRNSNQSEPTLTTTESANTNEDVDDDDEDEDDVDFIEPDIFGLTNANELQEDTSSSSANESHHHHHHHHHGHGSHEHHQGHRRHHQRHGHRRHHGRHHHCGRKQFFHRYVNCMVQKYKDDPNVISYQSQCANEVATYPIIKRAFKKNKCVLRKLKSQCSGLMNNRQRLHRNRRNRHHH